MDTPAAEIAISAALVDRLVREQHPRFVGPVELVAHGWDNELYRLGARYVARLPRREAAVALIEHEQRWLPSLARRMPVEIPSPVAVGAPSANFPWPWSIARWFDGQPAAALPLVERRTLAAPLADALLALHVPAPGGAPVNPVRGVPLADRNKAMRDRLGAVSLPASTIARLSAIWEHGLAATAWPDAPVWVHGDPHPLNAIVDETGALTALIDFGDLTAGDPATDLAAAWTFFDAEGRSAFRDRMGGDAALWRRAAAWAVALSLAILISSDDAPDLATIARGTIEQLLGDGGT